MAVELRVSAKGRKKWLYGVIKELVFEDYAQP